jgi:tRNA A-37 threonylcarbamoyl transferase component Bud32
MDTKICPYCREVIKIDAVKCKHCQTVLSGPSETLVFDPATAVRVALAAKYELVGEIGRGGMAIVYKAVHKGLGRTVALKVLPQHLAHEQELLDRFHREARALANLKHPSIIPVYDEGFENGIHYFAMEFLEGKNLSAIITEKGRLTVQEIVPIVTQIAGALDHIHSHGLVHRDVKSSNIFINNEGVPVLMDFGVAHQLGGDQLTAKGMILGTPEFMSPEQASGAHVDGRSDLYSLGVVLYHALSGHFPHVGETPLMTLHKTVTDAYVPLRNMVQVPEWVEHATSRCLEKDPAKRVQSGKVLIQLLREENQSARSNGTRKPARAPQTASTKSVRPATTKRGIAWKALVVVGVVVLLAGSGFVAKTMFLKTPVVIVPSVLGITQFEAEQKLVQSKLTFGGVERRWGLAADHDLVIEQRPGVGTQVSPGASVSLVVCIGKTAVPELKGLTIEEAIAALKKASLALGDTTRVAGLPEQKDRIMLMYPHPGTELGKDGKVNLSIGE